MHKAVACLLVLVASAHAAPVHLKTNARIEALGIDTPQPTFSWRSDAKTPNWLQSSYEVLVASRAELLVPGRSDAWDSGRVHSSASLDVVYAGAPLVSQHRYLWKVIVWDNHGQQSASAPAWFETGLMHPGDWKAEWITAE